MGAKEISMSKDKLIEQIGNTLIQSGMVKNCYDPNWTFMLESIINDCAEHCKQKAVEAVTACDYEFTGGGYMGGQITCVSLNDAVKAIEDSFND
jgi:hypothetical protein